MMRRKLAEPMASVVQLSDYRKARRARRSVRPADDATPHYFCLRCDSDHFKLFASGSVHCASCGALMRNITVIDAEKGKAGTK